MARTAGKKQSKPATQSIQPQVNLVAASSSIPKPFVPAPASLRPLFSTLPTDHLYAIHVDTAETSLKKRVYIVPILLNLVITCLLAVRVYYAAPVYLDQIITIFGFETAWKVTPSSMAYADILTTVAERTGLLMMDWAIFGFIGSWPWEFLFGSKYSRHTGPWGWRRNIGFRDTEIVVRKGRKWDQPLFTDENQTWSREDELLIQVKAEAALRKNYTSKTGYLLLDKDWDLDFKAMIDAHHLVGKERLAINDLDHIVLVYYKKQWLLWQVHESTQPATVNLEDDATIRKFREKLVGLGCEEIFFRWIEIIQYETSLPSGFTTQKQGEALRELRRLLTDRKVDYDVFLKEIGGQQSIPGISKVG